MDDEWETIFPKVHKKPVAAPAKKKSPLPRSATMPTFAANGMMAATIEKYAISDEKHSLTVTPVEGREIGQMRTQKKLTQVQLANAINVPPSVIVDIEKGAAVRNGEIMAKIRMALRPVYKANA